VSQEATVTRSSTDSQPEEGHMENSICCSFTKCQLGGSSRPRPIVSHDIGRMKEFADIPEFASLRDDEHMELEHADNKPAVGAGDVDHLESRR
jgi:hypothetical protein